MRGFWNDPDGLSIAELATVLSLPIWMYVAIKFARAPDLTANQVDYFTVLSYPLLIAVGGKAIGSLPLLWRRGQRMQVQDYQEQEYATAPDDSWQPPDIPQKGDDQ